MVDSSPRTGPWPPGETHAQRAAAAKAGLTLVESLQDAELVAVAGQAAPADAALNDKSDLCGR